jgi:site-specific DNA-methyltransferase (adenine-specific)
MKTKTIEVKKIKKDEQYQFRIEELNKDAIERYKDMYKSGTTEPLVIQKGTNILIDGFHRFDAIKELKYKLIDVVELDVLDEELKTTAFRLNAKHGIPPTKEERDKIIVELREQKKTQEEIGALIGLSQNRIAEILKDAGVSETDTFAFEIINLFLDKTDPKEIEKKIGCSKRTRQSVIQEFKDLIQNSFETGQTIQNIQKQIKDNYKIKTEPQQIIEILKERQSPLAETPKLIQGDCVKELDNIPNKIVDLIYVDPPYAILDKKRAEWDTFKNEEQYWKFTEQWLDKLLPKLKDTGRLFISFSQERMWKLKQILDKKTEKQNLVFGNTIVWNYRNNIKPGNKKQFKYTWEPVFHYYKKDAPKLNQPGIGIVDWSGESSDVDVWIITQPQTNYNEDKKYHPTQKPKELLRKIIQTTTNEKDLILDCFGGGGTTAIVAKEEKRNWILIEKNKEYVQQIKERLNNG